MGNMVHQPVNSSFITHAGHDGETTGEVTLAGGRRYRIHDIDAGQFQALLDAESVGKHFNQTIKKNHAVEPVDDGA